MLQAHIPESSRTRVGSLAALEKPRVLAKSGAMANARRDGLLATLMKTEERRACLNLVFAQEHPALVDSPGHLSARRKIVCLN
jgi:hypothetical protein